MYNFKFFLEKNTRMHIKFLLLFFLTNIYIANGQVVINEVCSSNDFVIFDEDGEAPDWVELYNIGNTAVNLEGWFLSDKLDEPQKWTFPSKSIAPGEFLLIFASGKDKSDTYLHTSFKLSKDGEYITLIDASETLIDKHFIPDLITDMSFGRLLDGGDEWRYFQTTSPGISNENGVVIERCEQPVFSVEKCFQDASFTLEILTPEPNGIIRYTLDGSIPNAESLIYDAPLFIEQNTPIRACTFKNGQLPSAISTKSYFVSTHHTLPVIHLFTDPDNLFEYENGILVEGPDASPNFPFWGANFWKDIEVPIHFDYFDENQDLKVSLELGTKIHGGRGTRTKPQKAMRITTKPKFGSDIINFPFFKDKPTVNSFERLVLRNSGGDFSDTHFRSGFMSQYINNSVLDVDALGYEPSILYLNGMYWGVINLREKSDEFYIESNYGIPSENIDFLEEDTFIVVGNFDIFHQHFDFVTGNDMAIESNFQQAASYFDIPSMTDYLVAQLTIANTDWPQGNIKYWRERREGAKWRYLLFDLDTSMGRYAWTHTDRKAYERIITQQGETNPHVILHRALMENENYKNYFLNRYADMLNTVFAAEQFSAAVEAAAERIRPEMPQHYDRWSDCFSCSTMAAWDSLHLPNLLYFAENRAITNRGFLQEFFGFENQVNLTLSTYPENAGSIQINTIIPEKLPWDGYYFNGVPVTLTVIPNEGFEFSHWEAIEADLSNFLNDSFALNFEKDDQITAYFEAEYEGLKLTAFPNPTDGETTISFVLDQIETIDVQLFGIDGQLMQSFPKEKLNGGLQQLTLDLSAYKPGIYIIEMQTSGTRAATKVIIE